ncbi:MAG: S41 family peptidase [Paludibacter sp.]|nr:S41 family peptidase [Paludibacter sp.]
MKKLIFLFILVSTTVLGQSKYQKDFNEFWTIVNENYAYLEVQQINWNKVNEIYKPKVANIHNRNEFVSLLENVVNELHNGHISLNTNLNSSNRIIPSGSDLFVQKVGNTYLITDIRMDHPSQKCGLKPGMQVTKFNGKKIDELLPAFLPKYTHTYNAEMLDYALNMLFAGTHDKKRVITVLENGREKEYQPDDTNIPPQKINLLDFKIMNDNTGYIKINNSLGHDELIPAFDKALDSLSHTGKLIIDLSETPGGGTSAIARAILGRFIGKELPYQKHDCLETKYKIKRSWTEYVTPRKATYNQELIILVGHWTGSMGEGMAIGFDGMERAKIVGTRMAGLIGAIDKFQLTETNIGFQIPTERVYHINGMPREDFKPGYLTDNIFSTWKKVKELFDI